jgi:two-component system cell cycle sensor histidine kinase/response regulator CckA
MNTSAMPVVLVVDDEESVRNIVLLALTKCGYEVQAAGDAPAALAHIDLHQEIDVVLLDVHLPGLDGPGALRAMQAKNPRLHFCFMTGQSRVYSDEDLLAAGAAAVLHKPFTLEALESTVRQVLEAQ